MHCLIHRFEFTFTDPSNFLFFFSCKESLALMTMRSREGQPPLETLHPFDTTPGASFLMFFYFFAWKKVEGIIISRSLIQLCIIILVLVVFNIFCLFTYQKKKKKTSTSSSGMQFFINWRWIVCVNVTRIK